MDGFRPYHIFVCDARRRDPHQKQRGILTLWMFGIFSKSKVHFEPLIFKNIAPTCRKSGSGRCDHHNQVLILNT